MPDYQAPGVYLEETSPLLQPVAQVETAIPAFLGYTEKGMAFQPVRIENLKAYQSTFGAPKALESVQLKEEKTQIIEEDDAQPKFLLAYGIELYFANGGGPCYIIPVGNHETLDKSGNPFPSTSKLAGFEKGLQVLSQIDEVTLIVLMDLPENATSFYQKAFQQCAILKDRFTIVDVPEGADIASFRSDVGNENLMYGAAYTPHLITSISPIYTKDEIQLNGKKLKDLTPKQQHLVGQFMKSKCVKLPPSPAIAGIHAMIDANQGVWKALLNVSLSQVISLTKNISQQEQESLNIDPLEGKSINAIRSFPGQGILLWGARTLAGNDNEWRYVNVRRFFNMVEESVRKSIAFAAFESNDAHTWASVKALIENYLLGLWQQGGLAGAKSEQAYFVKVGLNETMTQTDMDQGIMNVEIGMAVLRPAEFVILKISHKISVS